MKKNYFLILSIAAMMFSCQDNQDNNKTLDYQTLDVNFGIKTAGFQMPANTTYGVAAYCARDGRQDVAMNAAKNVLAYTSLVGGESSNLIKASDGDIINASQADHDFKFYAIYPYASDVDFSAVPAAVPSTQAYADDAETYLAFTAFKRTTSIIATADLEAKTPFAVLNLTIPIDIVEEGVPSTLRSVTMTPADQENFPGALAGEGSIDAETGEFSLASANRSKSITLEFPAEGLAVEPGTAIRLAVIPFTTPQGGFELEFTDINGNTYTTSILNQQSDAGGVINAGSITNITVTRSADGVIPVTFPVIFPIGQRDGVNQITPATQPKWVTEGLWICQDQPQAYAQWNKVSDPAPSPTQFLEIVNATSGGVAISTVGVKGVWTGDYYEFVLPVKNFAAGSTVRMQFPFYGRAHPVFWYVKYLDGDNWKTHNLHREVCYDGFTSMECTFSLPRDVATIYSFDMTFGNEIKSGFLSFRLECADGSIQADAGGAAVRDKPFVSGSNYGAPCYFRANISSSVNEISFSIVQ